MRRLVSALVATAVAVVVGAGSHTPSAHAAACSQWDLSWLQLKQSNGYIVGLPSQNGSYFSGRANLSTYGPGWVRPFSGGFAQGWTYGNRFTMTIYWARGGAGNYDAYIYPDGSVHGYTTDRYNSSSSARFWSMTNARCRY